MTLSASLVSATAVPVFLSLMLAFPGSPAAAFLLKHRGDALGEEATQADTRQESARRRKREDTARNLHEVHTRSRKRHHANSGQPHIVFVLADDLGWNGVGYTSSNINKSMSKVKTPFIDKLAADGVRLDSYYAAAYCAPSRFALLTGRAPWNSEAGYNNFRSDTPIGTNLAYEMLPAALKKVGYRTHLVGKWHQGFHMAEYLPNNRGFDTAFGIMDSCSHHFTQEIYHNEKLQCSIDGHAVIDILEDGAPFSGYTAGALGDDLYRERAVKLIQAHNQTMPLFLFLSLQLAHEPFEITEEYSSKYSLSEEENVYWGMHSHVDDTVKAIVQALEDSDMYSDTILVFTSDNGAPADKFDQPFFANFPLRGHKGMLFDGGIHVPCFVHGGALPEAARGRTLTGLMSVSDWYATFAHVSGAELHNGGPSAHDSRDQWEYIIGASTESSRDEIQNHYMLGDSIRQSMIRWGKYKMINFHLSCEYDSPFPCPAGHRPCTPTEPCVYDLEADPAETIDISASIPDTVKQMVARADATWELAYAQPFFAAAFPSRHEPDRQKACAEFQKQGGFLTPWATPEDEIAFNNRELSVKMEALWSWPDPHKKLLIPSMLRRIHLRNASHASM